MCRTKRRASLRQLAAKWRERESHPCLRVMSPPCRSYTIPQYQVGLSPTRSITQFLIPESLGSFESPVILNFPFQLCK